MKKKILIVDDEEDQLHILKNILAWHFYEITEAQNGQEAITLYKKLEPDLVIMDVIMPGISGLEAAESMLTYDPGAKIIIVSVLSEEKIMQSAKDVEFTSFIRKPLNKKQVLHAVERALTII